MDLDVKMKAVMLGAVFLIVRLYNFIKVEIGNSWSCSLAKLMLLTFLQDFMFFETAGGNANRHRHHRHY